MGDNIDLVHMERHDVSQNMHRYYRMSIVPNLFLEFTLIREWGRVGSPGTVRNNWYQSVAEANTERQKIINAKTKRGYKLII